MPSFWLLLQGCFWARFFGSRSFPDQFLPLSTTILNDKWVQLEVAVISVSFRFEKTL